jgi:hypothetical protein
MKATSSLLCVLIAAVRAMRGARALKRVEHSSSEVQMGHGPRTRAWFMVSMNHWVSGAKRSASSPMRLHTSARCPSSLLPRRKSSSFSAMTCMKFAACFLNRHPCLLACLLPRMKPSSFSAITLHEMTGCSLDRHPCLLAEGAACLPMEGRMIPLGASRKVSGSR